MKNAKRIGYLWALAVALGTGLAVANTPAVASAAPGGSGKGSSSGNSSQSNGARTPHQHSPKKFGSDLRKGGTTSPTVVKAAATHTPSPPLPSIAALTVTQPAAPTVTTAADDPDFITSSHSFFGLLSVTSAADPDNNNFVAFVLRTPLFTDVLTSGTDPEDILGFGAASTGVAGHTVNTFSSPLLNFSLGIPVTDPFAVFFTSLVRAGFWRLFDADGVDDVEPRGSSRGWK